MEDMSFDKVDAKLQYIMLQNISLELCVVLNKIIDGAMNQTNSEYYASLEQFEKKHLLPILN